MCQMSLKSYIYVIRFIYKLAFRSYNYTLVNKKGVITAQLNIVTRILRTMNNIATKQIVTLINKTIGAFDEALDNLISIYLTPLKLGLVNILVIGC